MQGLTYVRATGCLLLIAAAASSGQAGVNRQHAGGFVSVRVRAPFEKEATVTCVIPGHHRSGREVYADLLAVDDGELDFEFSDRCGYESDFSYSSAGS